MNRRRSFWKITCMVVLLIGGAAAGYVLGLHAGREEHAGRADFSTYTPEELSWVAEGIMEEISELWDDLQEIRGCRASQRRGRSQSTQGTETSGAIMGTWTSSSTTTAPLRRS